MTPEESTQLLKSKKHTVSYASLPIASSPDIDIPTRNLRRKLISRAKSMQNSILSAEFTQYFKKTRDVKTGERIWYDSYTTIDWLGDSQKEQTRLRELMKKDKWVRVLDKLEDWTIIIIVGVVTGLVAGFIAQWTEIMSDLKFGYCKRKWNLDVELCKGDWVTWKSYFGNSEQMNYLMFCIVGVLLSACAAQLVLLNYTKIEKSKYYLQHSFSDQADPPKFAYYGAGSGIPEVKTILSGFVIHGFLGLRILLVKSFGLVLAVASGVMVGKEGPFVHIASCIGNISSRIYTKFSNESRRRQLISASAAAGVSVAFGAPIGGVLFSLEEVSYYFSNSTLLSSFFCALVAAIVLRAYDPFGTGKIVMFQVFYDHNYSLVEMPFFILVGVFGGLWGAFYVHCNSTLNRIRKTKLPTNFAAFEVFLVTLATLSISYHNPATSMGLGQMVGSLFQECKPEKTPGGSIFCVGSNNSYSLVAYNLAVALLVRGFFSIITFGLKIPSGLVLPSMSIGAIFGRLVGTGVQYLAEEMEWSFLPKCSADSAFCVTPGVYALVGAGATLTGSTRTTISVAVIMFELTESLTYTLPVMVAIITAKFVADFWGTQSIYDKIMDLAGYPFIDTKVNYVFTKYFAGDLVHQGLPFIDIDQINTISVLRNILTRIIDEGYSDGGIALVNKNRHLIGSISCEELINSVSQLSDWPQETVCIFENNSLAMAIPTSAPVCASPSKRMNSNSSRNASGKQCKSKPRNNNISSLPNGLTPTLNDFSNLVNVSPLCVKYNAPTELASQLFSRLGVSYICVERDDQFYGVIPKKRFISYLEKLETIGMTH